MSRRTRLLITSTLLVLLAIPVTYLACIWSTQNPLRFEVTRLETDGNSSVACTTMDITVRNTSNLPVHLDPPRMEATDNAGRTDWVLGFIFLPLADGSQRSFSESVFLPPGGSMPCSVTVFAEMDAGSARKYLESIEVHYRWRSGIVEKIGRLYDRWMYEGPENLHLLIPRPKDSHHRAPLELPATTSP